MRAAWLLVLVCACSHDQAAPPPSQVPAPAAIATQPVSPINPPRPAQLSHVTIKALGMYCEESCPMRVRYALAELKQIYELGFDPANESIFVSYDAALGEPKVVTKPMLVAIKNAGFDPWLAKTSWPDDAKVQVVPR
ncbi:MAG: heavy-metal-associated domain-containing protein [Deltaproteobacteria bacterium]